MADTAAPAAESVPKEEAAPAAGGNSRKEKNAGKDDASVPPMTPEDLEKCDIMDMAKDKYKSRLLQRSLVRGGPEALKVILERTEPHFMELVKDQYGHYLSQKILEGANEEQWKHLFGVLKGQLKDLASDVHGTRAVQKVVEQAVQRSCVDQLLEALPVDLVEGLARSLTGFHVAVKMLESLPAKEAEVLLDRLCGTAAKALALGTDQWGCCVLKKCIDRSQGETREKIVDAIANGALALVQDAYGNYIVQHLIMLAGQDKKGNNADKTTTIDALGRIVDALKNDVYELSRQKFSSNVLEKLLLSASDPDRLKLVNGVMNPNCEVQPSEAVRTLLFHQYGNYVLQQALEVAKEPQFSLLVEHCKKHVQDLVKSARATEQDGKKLDDSGNLPPEHARRLAMKLAKKYPTLAEGVEAAVARSAAAGLKWEERQAQGSWAGGPGWANPAAFGSAPFGAPNPYGNPYLDPGMQAAALAASANAMYGYPGYNPFAGGYDMSGGLAAAYPPYGGVPNMHAGGKPTKGRGKGGGGGGGSGRGARGGRGGRGAGGGEHPAHVVVGDDGVANVAPSGASPGEYVENIGPDGKLRVGRIVGFWPNYTITYDEVTADDGGPGGGRGGGRGGGGRGGKAKAKGKASQRKKAPMDP